MIVKLAYRNLTHDRVRLIVTVAGVVFAVTLVTIQLGLFLGFTGMISAALDHSTADIWVVPSGTKDFDDAPTLDERERYAALAVPGVRSVSPLIVRFVEWKDRQGDIDTVLLVGVEPNGALQPWNLIAGSAGDLQRPDSVIVDASYLTELGVAGTGASAEIEGRRAQIVGLTDGIRSFTTSPYVFTTLDRARNYSELDDGRYTFLLLRLVSGADAVSVRRALAGRLRGAEVLTPSGFKARNRDYWMFKTGAGTALLGGAVLGLLVGCAIVAQTLYASTKDHIGEFATLRALGCSNGYIYKVILAQAAVSGAVGYLLAMLIACIVVLVTRGGPMPVSIPPVLALTMLAVTLVMCAIASITSIAKVTRLDPATVYT